MTPPLNILAELEIVREVTKGGGGGGVAEGGDAGVGSTLELNKKNPV